MADTFMPPWLFGLDVSAKKCKTRHVLVGWPLEALKPSGAPTLRKESGLTAEALAEQTPVLVLLEAVGAVVGRQGAVFQRRAEHGAHRFIRRL